jgi:hypothetical protein
MGARVIKCSLCHHLISEDELRLQPEDKIREASDDTIGLIKSSHPGWSQNDPTCQLCWDYYRKLP